MVDLKAKGIENAAALLGGFVAWQNAGYAIEKSAQAATKSPPAQIKGPQAQIK
ncbi:MAG TPA: hypothetical protein VJU86_23480 [Pyrinomonadaceae bacterium]|nr:hypothetical protein [Pyrinomonadaceae bacterium]